MTRLPDLHERTHDEIQRQIDAIDPGHDGVFPPEGLTEEQTAALTDLTRDMATLKAHWKTETGLIGQNDSLGGDLVRAAPPRAQACGNPQPCPHVLQLAQRYGVIAGTPEALD